MNHDSQLVREALQARLLVELMGNSMHRELVLKGGLAMRAVHGSVRHTKDIDLDADSSFARARIHGIVVHSIRDALAAGLIEGAQVTEPKQTDTTMRWKINGHVPGQPDSPINLTLEISRRARDQAAHIIEKTLSEDFAPGAGGTKVVVLDSQAIAATKVIAMTDPKRVAPRDVYDLFVLIQAEVTPPAPLLASQPKERLEEALRELWPKLESMDYALFSKEVLPVIPEALARSIDRARYEEMQLTVGERVERWLQEALAIQAGTTTPPGLGGGLMGSVAPGAEAAPAMVTVARMKP